MQSRGTEADNVFSKSELEHRIKSSMLFWDQELKKDRKNLNIGAREAFFAAIFLSVPEYKHPGGRACVPITCFSACLKYTEGAARKPLHFHTLENDNRGMIHG